MIVYKKDECGSIIELHTEGGYRPKGWSKTIEAAERKRSKRVIQNEEYEDLCLDNFLRLERSNNGLI